VVEWPESDPSRLRLIIEHVAAVSSERELEKGPRETGPRLYEGKYAPRRLIDSLERAAEFQENLMNQPIV
jgi:hypothetical protein